VLRNLIWRAVAIAGALIGLRLLLGLLHGSIGRTLHSAGRSPSSRSASSLPAQAAHALAAAAPRALLLVAAAAAVLGGAIVVSRSLARRRRRYVRLQVLPYRTDHADPRALARMYAAVHAVLAERRGARARRDAAGARGLTAPPLMRPLARARR
jgi:hypothetical protein